MRLGPGGKKNYPLDLIYPRDWNPGWTTALIDLQRVLMRLTELEPAQADLLDCILSGRLPSASDLQSSGTRWPQTPRDRAPRYSITSLGASSSVEGQFLLSVTDEGGA